MLLFYYISPKITIDKLTKLIPRDCILCTRKPGASPGFLLSGAFPLLPVLFRAVLGRIGSLYLHFAAGGLFARVGRDDGLPRFESRDQSSLHRRDGWIGNPPFHSFFLRRDRRYRHLQKNVFPFGKFYLRTAERQLYLAIQLFFRIAGNRKKRGGENHCRQNFRPKSFVLRHRPVSPYISIVSVAKTLYTRIFRKRHAKLAKT